MKYSKEFKLECVQRYKNGDYIEDPPEVKHSNFRDQVRKWARTYDSLGEKGLEHGRPTLDINQRIELFNRVEAGESYTSVALSAGILDDLLIKWHKIYQEKGIDGLILLKRGKSSMAKANKDVVKKDPKDMTREELLEALEMATIENEYLKKLSALVQKRNAQEQKKN